MAYIVYEIIGEISRAWPECRMLWELHITIICLFVTVWNDGVRFIIRWNNSEIWFSNLSD